MRQIPDQLPPALQEPMTPEALVQRMWGFQKVQWTKVAPQEPVTFRVRTCTKVDVGQWFSNGRVWLFCAASNIVLMAAGRRPLVETVPWSEAKETTYNHVTGELVLTPARGITCRRLKMMPLEGYQVLAQIARYTTTT